MAAKMVKPDNAEVRRNRIAVRATFTGRSNPMVGVSDAVLLSNRLSSQAARQAEREWKRTLSRGQRRKLRST
jgi:hypothetical protein